jgi:hypothetical protein
MRGAVRKSFRSESGRGDPECEEPAMLGYKGYCKARSPPELRDDEA